MDGLFKTTQTFNGKKTSAIYHNIQEMNVSEGKEGQAIYFQNINRGNGAIEVSISEPDCFCNFQYCSNRSVSISIWIKAFSFSGLSQIITMDTAAQRPTLGMVPEIKIYVLHYSIELYKFTTM